MAGGLSLARQLGLPAANNSPSRGRRVMPLATAGGPRAGHKRQGSTGSEATGMSALQQHIDDLTQEKFDLVRGLKEQQRLAGVLADENQAMTDEFNRQAAQIQQGRTEVRRCQEQIAAQHLALQGLAAERDACRQSAQEASQQVKALAAEVVSLEECCLHLRSSELRAAVEAEGAAEVRHRSEHRSQMAAQEVASLEATIQALREESKVLREMLRNSSAAVPSPVLGPTALPGPAASGGSTGLSARVLEAAGPVAGDQVGAAELQAPPAGVGSAPGRQVAGPQHRVSPSPEPAPAPAQAFSAQVADNVRRQQQQQAGLAPLSEEARQQSLQHLQAQQSVLLPQLSGQLGAMAGSTQEHQAAVHEIQDMLAHLEWQQGILVAALKRKHPANPIEIGSASST
eukprot:jgi/Astpho2/864/fgenesh1_pg.00016_%23_77_t